MDAGKLSEKSQSILNTFHAVTDTMRLINKGAFPGEEAAKLLSSLGFLRAVALNAIDCEPWMSSAISSDSSMAVVPTGSLSPTTVERGFRPKSRQRALRLTIRRTISRQTRLTTNHRLMTTIRLSRSPPQQNSSRWRVARS
jgi:hypothetical protein